jgi:hypothetical protein
VRELKTVVVDGLGRLERIIFSESAETHAYVDLTVGEVRAEVRQLGAELRGEMGQLGVDLREEMRQQRQLTGAEFARAAGHADTLFEKLRVQLVLMAEHQAMLFERQERDHRG